ncbi:hypothetical protein AVEN_68729-1 [Araneus ventricosus]|uniref:Uncharacterized protein n=1 Tax=Araneus ventricosus TaxID=182803 RepID=A0A4Y2UYM6_ARAVE|nr:hypothetical protein AVEN_68729-1 [Araneus ventricosus]
MCWSDALRFQRPHEAMDASCQQGTVEAGGSSIMVWAVLTWQGLSPIVKLNPIIYWKWLYSATWRPFAAIHGLHVPKQIMEFSRMTMLHVT